jgi:L-arabinonolactonase
MAVTISRVDTATCLVGEGALWDAQNGLLYYLDITGRKVHRYDPERGTTRSWTMPGSVGSFALRVGGGAVVALKDSVHALDLETGALTHIATFQAMHERATINDGKVDRRGRFIMGGCDTSFTDTLPIGGLLSLGADHVIRKIDGDIAFSNGPCWSPNNSILYFSDSHVSTTYAYDYDLDTGLVANRRPFVNSRAMGLDGDPDGATVDSEGRVWMAIYEGGKIAAFRPDGTLERIVPMPVSLAVSVTFGGPDLDRLYVTTIDPAFFNKPAEEGAGAVFVIDGLGVRGLPEPRYAG